MKRFLDSAIITQQSKAARILGYLEEVFSRVWLKSRQLSLIVKSFEDYGSCRRTENFGTYRVDLIVKVFSRILDLHNFEIVLQSLDPYETGCLIARIGWLKLFNPMKPEGSYTLDVSRYEERLIAKVLCALEFKEPGDNWMSCSFRWDLILGDIMPGWMLTSPWLTTEGKIS